MPAEKAPEMPELPKETPPEVAELKPEEIATEEILNEILNNLNRPDLELVDFETKPGTVAGDNYMSIMYALKLNMKHKRTGEKEQVSIMLKLLPRNEMRIKMINDGNIFVRDINFYSTIAPALERFQREKGLPEAEIFTPWPKCYACKTDGKEDYLAMEDLKTTGFQMASRKEGLDLEHCKMVMKAQARFHAVSYAMFSGDFDNVLEKYPWLEEMMFDEEKNPPVWKDMITSTFKEQVKMLQEQGDEQGAARIEQIYSENWFARLRKLAGDKVPWAVIGHGDCWTNNLLFSYDEETKKPLDIKFVDFQMNRVASRLVDIHYFMYTSPTVQVLNENEQELEDIYYDEFTSFAKKLGVDIDAQELTKENFLKEIEDFRYYGCVTGLMLAMVTSADSSDVPDMESISEEQMNDKDGMKDFFLAMMKGKALKKIANIANIHLPRC